MLYQLDAHGCGWNPLRRVIHDTGKVNRNPKQAFLGVLRSEPAPAMRAAIIEAWANENRIPLSTLQRGRSICRILAHSTASALDTIRPFAAELKTIKQVERAFEYLMHPDTKRSHGAVYTPDYIIDYIVREGLRLARIQRPGLPAICDPSCGMGSFLIRAASILREQYSIPVERAFAELLTGIDTDPQAIAHCGVIIEMFLAAEGVSLDDCQYQLYRNDTLLDTTGPLEKRYDLVATNPPYVKLQNLSQEYREQLLARYRSYISGNFSLALLFLLRGYQLLNEGGCTAYITQNNLYTSLAAVKIRAFLQQEQCIRRIVDFGHQHIFEGASAYTCLAFLTKSLNNEFEFATVASAVTELAPGKIALSRVQTSELAPRKWRLGDERHLANLRRIEEIGTPLGRLFDIKVGFATLKDFVFFVSDEGDADFCRATLPDGKSIYVERDATRPAIKISELQSEADIADNKRRIIFPYAASKRGMELMPEETFAANYPGAYSYLEYWREELGKRDKGKSRTAWYAWGRSQSLRAPGPKLLTKTFSSKPDFFLNDSDDLFCNGYAIFRRSEQQTGCPDFRVLQKILNSAVMHYYAKLTSFEIEGDYQCYQKNFIEKFGIPSLTPQQQAELSAIPEGDDLQQAILKLYRISPDDIMQVIGATPSPSISRESGARDEQQQYLRQTPSAKLLQNPALNLQTADLHA